MFDGVNLDSYHFFYRKKRPKTPKMVEIIISNSFSGNGMLKKPLKIKQRFEGYNFKYEVAKTQL